MFILGEDDAELDEEVSFFGVGFELTLNMHLTILNVLYSKL